MACLENNRPVYEARPVGGVAFGAWRGAALAARAAAAAIALAMTLAMSSYGRIWTVML